MTTALTREFPDFDPATLPAIPAGFWPTHWHNDSCPTWHEQPQGPKPGSMMLAIDYADPALREDGRGKRFNLHVYSGDFSPEPICCSDDWDTIITTVKFIRYVRDIGIGFHPDTRGADYVGPGDARVFTDEQAAEYDATIAALDTDAYELGIQVWKACGLVEE